MKAPSKKTWFIIAGIAAIVGVGFFIIKKRKEALSEADPGDSEGEATPSESAAPFGSSAPSSPSGSSGSSTSSAPETGGSLLTQIGNMAKKAAESTGIKMTQTTPELLRPAPAAAKSTAIVNRTTAPVVSKSTAVTKPAPITAAINKAPVIPNTGGIIKTIAGVPKTTSVARTAAPVTKTSSVAKTASAPIVTKAPVAAVKTTTARVTKPTMTDRYLR